MNVQSEIFDTAVSVSKMCIECDKKHLPIHSRSIVNYSHCKTLTHLSNVVLPVWVSRLICCCCTALEDLPNNLPINLRELDCSYCTSLTELPDLPNSLEVLNCSNCTSLKRLPDRLPIGLHTLLIINCTSFTELPNNLPTGLEKLYLTGCTSLIKLPNNLPVRLRYMSCMFCSALTELPYDFPTGIDVNFSGCNLLIGSNRNYITQSQAIMNRNALCELYDIIKQEQTKIWTTMILGLAQSNLRYLCKDVLTIIKTHYDDMDWLDKYSDRIEKIGVTKAGFKLLRDKIPYLNPI
jgi:hypothetical protein